MAAELQDSLRSELRTDRFQDETGRLMTGAAQDALSAEREHASGQRRMETLHRAAQAAMTELDPQELAASLARFSTQIAGGTQCLVCLKKDRGLEPCAAWPDNARDLLWNRQEDLVRKALRRRRADLYFTDTTDPVTGETTRQSHVVAPLLDTQRQVIGTIVLARPIDPSGFKEADLRAVETLALMYSASFSRGALFDRLQEWSRSFEMVLAFNSAVNRHLPPEELVKRLVELAVTFLKADGGMAGFAITGQNGEMAMASDAYYDAQTWHEYRRRWNSEQGAPGYVMRAEFAFLSNNYADDPAADHDLVHRFRVHKLLCVPIRDARDLVLGFFALHREEDAPPFTWQDAAFLETLGNSTAVAIENVRLLQTLESKNEQIRSLSQDHVERLEQERRHIARELHDETGQVLVGIKLGLQVLSRSIPPESVEMRKELARLGGLVAQSSVQLRDLARNLRPPTLDNLGVGMALEQLVRDYERRTGLETRLTFDALPSTMEEPVRIALYRIAQEALTNIAKHARATRVEIGLRCYEKTLELSIEDDGRGFDPLRPCRGLGLLGMKERAGMLGASLDVVSRFGKGTRICLKMPL